jgi:hypothetical protein
MDWYILQDKFSPDFLIPFPTTVVTFDIEASQKDDKEYIFALAVTIDQEGNVTKWDKGQEVQLVEYLCAHEVIVTYNGSRFDFQVLSRVTGGYLAQELTNKWLDISILTSVMSPTQSKPLRLWTVAMNTLLKYMPKLPWAAANTSGAEGIPERLKQGDREDQELIWRHCFDDVQYTREIYAFWNPGPLVLTYYYQSILERTFQAIMSSFNRIQDYHVSFKEELDEHGDSMNSTSIKSTELPYKDFQELLAEFDLYEQEARQYIKGKLISSRTRRHITFKEDVE